jgi:PTH2 family peptidyl-tRNA hydrolase
MGKRPNGRRMNRSEKDTKQVIVVRKDLNMRKGKMVAQGAHASLAFLTRRIAEAISGGQIKEHRDYTEVTIRIPKVEMAWMDQSFAKVCVSVDTEQELRGIYQQAVDANREVHLITDSGRTEFNGVATQTCLAIGPDYVDNIDPITGGLKLL